MRNFNTLSSQLDLNRNDQIVHPEQLEIGMEIGLLFFKPVRGCMRAVRALVKATPFTGEAGSWLEATRNGRQFRPDSHSMLPLVSESISNMDPMGVWLTSPVTVREPGSLAEPNMDTKPPQSLQFHSFPGMGLAPITSTADIGRWRPIATIHVNP